MIESIRDAMPSQNVRIISEAAQTDRQQGRRNAATEAYIVTYVQGDA